MSGLDLAVMGFVLIGLWRGFVNGLVRTTMNLVSWLVALFVATKFAHILLPIFNDVVDTPIFRTALAFLAVFLLVIAGLQFGVYLISKLLKVVKLSWLDKMAGGVIGAGVGILKVLVVLSFTAPLLVHTQLWRNSPLTQALVPYAPLAKTLLTQMANEVYDEFEQELKDQTNIDKATRTY